MTADDAPDYYAEFDIDRSATGQEISRRLDRAFRTWSSRASRAPDAKKRREAEDKVEMISEARRELLDRAKRHAYDRRLDTARQRRSPRSDSGPGRDPDIGPEPQPTQGTRDWVGHARRFIDQGNDEAALYELRQAVHHDDGDGDAWRLLAAVHAKRGLFADALQEFERARALHPHDALTHTLIARVHEQVGNNSAAADWHLKAVRLAPGDAGPLVDAANSLFLARRYDEALTNYEQALVKQPDHTSIRDQIGRIWSLRAEGAMVWHPIRQRYVIASATSASTVIHCVDQALAVGVSDSRLLNQLTAHRMDAVRAPGKTWRWRKNMIAVIAVCFVLLLVLPGAVSVLALAGLFGLPVAMGVKPRWQHTRNDLPPHVRPPNGRVS